MFCENCGSKLPEGVKFCMNCGAKAASNEPANEKAAQEAAAVTETTPAAEMPPVDYASPEARESSSAQAAAPIIDERAEQEPAAAKEPAAAQQPASAQPAYTGPAPSQAAPDPARTAQPQQYTSRSEKTAPLGILTYLGMMIVLCIPVIGFIMVLVWSFGGSFNRNTRNFARAILILMIIGFIFSIATVVTYWGLISSLFNDLNSLSSGFSF